MKEYKKRKRTEWFKQILCTALAIVGETILTRKMLALWPVNKGTYICLLLIGLGVIAAFLKMCWESYPHIENNKILPRDLDEIAEAIKGKPCELVEISRLRDRRHARETECICDVVFIFEDQKYRIKGISRTTVDRSIEKTFYFGSQRLKLVAA